MSHSRINENKENTRARARLASLSAYEAFRTLRKEHQQEWLVYYLEACERNGVNSRLKGQVA